MKSLPSRRGTPQPTAHPRTICPTARTWHAEDFFRILTGLLRGNKPRAFRWGRFAPAHYLRSYTRRAEIHLAGARCPQDVDAEGFFRVWTGFPAEITGEFFEDAALRAIRARLMSASGRPRGGRTKKAPVGFRAGQTRKKPSLSCHTPAAAR